MWFRILSRPLTPISRVHPYPLPAKSYTTISPQIARLSKRLQVNNPFRRLKSTTKKPAPQAQPGKKFRYPERLLIYHAGTGRTVFIGCLKVTTITIFCFFTFVAAPIHFQSPDQPNWIAAAVLICGLTPLLFIHYTTTPFTPFIHLRIPTYARADPSLLLRFTKTLPPSAEIDITTMNIIGRQRVSKIPLSAIYPEKNRFGVANVRRVLDPKTEAKRPWYIPRPPTLFSIGEKSGVVREASVWSDVRSAILKGQKMKW